MLNNRNKSGKVICKRYFFNVTNNLLYKYIRYVFLKLVLTYSKKKNGVIKKRCSVGIIPTRYKSINFIFYFIILL